ncbi:MAG: hypothetical protein U9R49_11330, partial [Bacteroidota bacterium]|nr:hypothetical protein [Bacteroidota bacterium]
KDLSTKILSELETRCEGIEFVGKEIISYDGKSTMLIRGERWALKVSDEDPGHLVEYKKNERVLQTLEKSKKDLDGLMLFFGGFSDRQYMLTELPTIIVDCSPFSSRQIGFKNAVALAERYRTKFITASYGTDVPESVSAVKLDDLVEKVKLFSVIRKMKNSKLISIQDHDGINRIDQGTYYDIPTNDYDLNYPGRLKEYFGVEMIIVRSKELNQEIAKVDDVEAEEIAEMWVEEATEVKNVGLHDIVRSARLYLAIKALLNKYDADAITLDTATLFFRGYGSSAWLRPEQKVNETFPLLIMELSKEYIQSCCQSHIDCLVTQMVGNYMTGGSGFTGDFLNDWEFDPTGARPENVMIVAHCGAPITPHKNGRIPYLIRDHIFRSEAFGPENTPTATTVKWPLGEVASIVKFDVYRKMVSVFTGIVLDGDSLYENFPNIICRNKIVIQIDDPEDCYMLPSNPAAGLFRQCDCWDIDHRHWGGHQVAFYGDLRRRIKHLTALIGFEVVDRDSGK